MTSDLGGRLRSRGVTSDLEGPLRARGMTSDLGDFEGLGE